MTQIEKYIERLKTLQNLYEEGQPQHNAFGIAIVEANKMLVKNCSIPDVVGQSEQLKMLEHIRHIKGLPLDIQITIDKMYLSHL